MRTARSRLSLVGTLALACLPAPTDAQPVGLEFQINTYTTLTQRTVSTPGGSLVAADASGTFVLVWQSIGQDGSAYRIFGQRYDSGGVPLGSEFRVNSYTTDWQSDPSVAAAADGDFVVVWTSRNQDGDRRGIFGQRYDSAGAPVGLEFRVNSYTTSDQQSPAVGSDANGNFVVVWWGQGQGDAGGVFGQRYDSAGGTLGGEFRVNSYTTYAQLNPSEPR